MRFLALAFVVTLAGCGRKGDTAPTTASDEPSPRVGRLAPPVQFDQWLIGDPLPGLEPGKVYVLDFWASWCGPCRQSMPHLLQVADEYAGRVTVIGVTAIDERNPMPAVLDVLAGLKANRHSARYATIPRTVAADYAVSGLPTAVVIGPDGRVAYRGSPYLVDAVLDGVLAGTWQGLFSVADLEAQADELSAILTKADVKPGSALAELTAFEAAYPDTARRVGFRVAKVSVLRAAGKPHEAKALTEELLPTLAKRKDARTLSQLRAIWTDAKRDPERKHAAVAVTAAEALVTVEGPADAAALGQLADALLFAGDKAKAKEVADKALAAAPEGAPIRTWLTELRKKCE